MCTTAPVINLAKLTCLTCQVVCYEKVPKDHQVT